MTLTIELGADPQVAFGPSPLGELISALHVLSAPTHHTAQHAWAAAVAATLPADLADRIDAASFLWQVGRADFLVPSAVRATLADDLDDLDALDEDTFRHAAFIPACGADRRARRTRPGPGRRTQAAAQSNAVGVTVPATSGPAEPADPGHSDRAPGRAQPEPADLRHSHLAPGPAEPQPADPRHSDQASGPAEPEPADPRHSDGAPGPAEFDPRHPHRAPAPQRTADPAEGTPEPAGRATPAPGRPEDRSATRARALSRARGPAQAEFVDRLLTDLPGLRAWLRRLFEDCEAAFFAEAWRQVRVRLVTDARDKSELYRRKGLAAAVEAMSPALSVRGTKLLIDKLRVSTATAEQRGITFAPTAFGWPHLVVSDEPGWRPVVQYPVAPEAVVPLDLVRRRMEALSNPARMRLCWLLARGAHTTGELAEAWQLSAPEVSRHLAVLHRAGLLERERRGRYTLHRLDLAAVGRLGSDLVEALLR
ncbi:DUF5937 family protein [Longispora sp. NPDC051575]|uniref:ArsR/SmtB family transcription factor n=1 Tax=Longispora sp. NPDC051575 TaxID=3154943 RepID=UPI00341F4B1F